MGRFAFLLHPVRTSDYYRKFPALRRLPERWVEGMFRPVPPWVGSHITGVQSPTGATAEGWFVFLPWTPRMLLETPWPVVRERIVRAGRNVGPAARLPSAPAWSLIDGRLLPAPPWTPPTLSGAHGDVPNPTTAGTVIGDGQAQNLSHVEERASQWSLAVGR